MKVVEQNFWKFVILLACVNELVSFCNRLWLILMER